MTTRQLERCNAWSHAGQLKSWQAHNSVTTSRGAGGGRGTCGALVRTLALVFVVLAGACGRGDDPPPPEQAVLAPNVELSEFQEEILVDGVVTRGEYERAVLAAIKCIEQAGFDIDGPTEVGSELRYNTGGEGKPGETHDELRTRIHGTTERCGLEYDRHVAAVYLAGQVPDDEERQQLRAGLARCLRLKSSADVDDASTLGELLAAVNALRKSDDATDRAAADACVQQFSDVFLSR